MSHPAFIAIPLGASLLRAKDLRLDLAGPQQSGESLEAMRALADQLVEGLERAVAAFYLVNPDLEVPKYEPVD